MKGVVASALFLATLGVNGAQAGLTTLNWSTGSSCGSGYGACAEMEFCERGNGGYGYRQAGTTDCLSPGPVIRMTPGTRYKLKLKNTTPQETNIHTHGLHIPGDGNADDVTRHAGPGECLDYNWDIPSSHMGGTYWYHAHKHGSTFAQVDGGALGMLIVEESTNGPTTEINGWMNNELLLVANADGTGNGLAQETFTVAKNEWYRLRVLTADPAATPKNLVIGSGCVARATAFDGVWAFNVPLEQESTFSLTGASRIDLGIKCSSNADVTYAGRNSVVATFVVDSSLPTTSNAPGLSGTGVGQWQPNRPAYLANLAQVQVDNQYAISMSAASINGATWDPANPLATLNFNTVQEWTISGSGAHPFHLHLYHMQVMSACGDHRIGEYYDTISATGSCTVRFKTADIGGRTVMHCHVLRHEDNGAMTWMNVVGGPAPPTGNIDPYTCSSSQCQGCTATYECGSDAGTDSCGNTCTVPTAPMCSDGQVCNAFNQCEQSSDPTCAVEGESCQVNSCCSGLTCPGGKPDTRRCQQARVLR